MMLSRVADALYWLGRYVERAEHLNRLLEKTSDCLLDMGDLDAPMQSQLWHLVADVFQAPSARDMDDEQLCSYMLFDSQNSCSLTYMISRARENARAVRDVVSSEMWRHINTIYWSLQSEKSESRALWESDRAQFYWSMYSGAQMFFGLTQDAIQHNASFDLITVGRFIERASITVRILMGHVDLLATPKWQALPAPLRTLLWVSLLKKCWCFEAYRKNHASAIEPNSIISFVLMTEDLPRSIRFSVEQVYTGLVQINREVDEHVSTHRGSVSVALPSARPDGVLRRFGRLSSQLEYADPQDIFARTGALAYLAELNRQLDQAMVDLHTSLFMYEPAQG